MNALPPPSSDAIAHSERLCQHIAAHLQQHENWISFAEYMQMVLYAPALGYYTAGAAKFGEAGDFVTAPLISPLFSQCLANFCLNAFAEIKHNHILELGAGTGVMAKDILLFLHTKNALPEHYFILEPSADLRARQQTFLAEAIPDLYPRVQWLNTLPQNFHGIILANEVLDAMPVNLFHYQDDVLYEVGVAQDAQGFIYKNKLANDLLQNAVTDLPISDKTNYLSEINLHLPAYVHSLSDALTQGLMVFIDYGFEEHTYYHPSRMQGTLMCHYRHRAHPDPFFYPGLQDVTAHVDFTRLARAAKACGMSVEYFSTQAEFLLQQGLIDLVQAQELDEKARLIQNQQIQILTAPQEMGELFKVMVLKK